MKIHKAGYLLLIKIFIILMIINALVFAFIGNLQICRITIGVSTIFYLLIVNFFRFPKRHIQVDDNTILCPADGKIVVIEETFEPEYLKCQCIQVSQRTHKLVRHQRNHKILQIPQGKIHGSLPAKILNGERTDDHCHPST